MSKLNLLLGLGLLGAAAFVYFRYGGLSGIGSALGSGISGLGNNFLQGINKFGNDVTPPNKTNTSARVIEQEGLQSYVTEVPTDVNTEPLTASQKSALTYAGFFEANNLGGTINLRTGDLTTRYGIQPLDFTFDGSGGINTGRIGLSNATLQAQAALSKQYGIPTFDTKGNLSTLGGFISGKAQAPASAYSNVYGTNSNAYTTGSNSSSLAWNKPYSNFANPKFPK